VDARSDLYSAGCLLYEMLTGRPPFIGDSPVSVAYQHVREIAEPAGSLNPEVSEALDSVLSKALQKNRADRFQDAAAFQRALRAARSGIPVPDVAADEAATELNYTVPATERTAQAAPYSLTGASFLDDTPSGRLRPVHDTLGDDRPLPAQVYEPSEASELPLGLPPERERTPRQKSRRRTWIATLVIFTLLVLAGGGLWLYNIMNQPPPPVAKVLVPPVTSLTETEALQKLYNARLSPQINRLQHDTITKGTAIGTLPAAGTAMEPESKVTLNISDGPSAVKIPDNLPGRTEAAARDVLRQIGLAGAPGTTMANSATVPAGIVITTKPAPGERVAIGSTVEIVVSTGKVAMPELRGLPRAEAEAALKNLGLGMAVKEVENSQVEPGKVTEQSDAVNALVDQGKTINVVIAKAPAPSPSPTPTPTPTESGRDRG
jgi:serine/threonine-protein kinase